MKKLLIGQCKNSRNSGFTIIELLIILSIIAILSAMLFPIFSSVRERGRQASCINNLHQIGLAMTLYLSDTNEVRPPRMQNLWDSGHIITPSIFICPDDASNNWGGLVSEGWRQLNLEDFPAIAPETLHYSYIDSFTQLSDGSWENLKNSQGAAAGIIACQLHGEKQPYGWSEGEPTGWIGDHEGLILRLQLDGAVVRRHTHWEHFEEWEEKPVTTVNSSLLFCDDLSAVRGPNIP